jgi:hypothetical protein
VNLISKPNLFSAARAARDAALMEKVARWYELITRNQFNNLVELQGLRRC